MANRFVSNAISYHGKGAINEIATEIKARGFKKAFVCSDPDLIKFGVTKKVTDVLDEAGIAYDIFSEIKPNPTIENVQTGVAAYKASGADYIIAIGGGSAIDAAKAIAALRAKNTDRLLVVGGVEWKGASSRAFPVTILIAVI